MKRLLLSTGLVASVVLALAGCPSSAGPSLGGDLVLGVGDSTTIPDINLWLRFAQVASDTRCPLQGPCPAAGEASIVVQITPNLGATRVDTLHTGGDPQSVMVGIIEVRLVRLDPYPMTPDPIPIRSYRATFITREIPPE